MSRKILRVALSLSLLALGACDRDEAPVKPVSPPPTPLLMPAPMPTPTPRLIPTPTPTPTPLMLMPAPMPPPAAVAPVEELSAAPAKPPASSPAASAPVRAEAAAPRAAARDPEQAPPVLDLSLPDDWLEIAEPDGVSETTELLPPLFKTTPQTTDSLQMGGRLIPGVDGDEVWIDGAELHFEIKH